MIREDARLGVGSLQWFVDCDVQQHYFTLFEDAHETHAELAQIALFDFVANNTDRKSGHVLRGNDGQIWGIDHGLCSSAVFELRTVIWDFAIEPTPDALPEDIPPLTKAVPAELAEPLDDVERLRPTASHTADGVAGVLASERTGMRNPASRVVVRLFG